MPMRPLPWLDLQHCGYGLTKTYLMTVIPRSLAVSTGDSVSLEVTEYENCSDMNGASYKLIFGCVYEKCIHVLSAKNRLIE